MAEKSANLKNKAEYKKFLKSLKSSMASIDSTMKTLREDLLEIEKPTKHKTDKSGEPLWSGSRAYSQMTILRDNYNNNCKAYKRADELVTSYERFESDTRLYG